MRCGLNVVKTAEKDGKCGPRGQRLCGKGRLPDQRGRMTFPDMGARSEDIVCDFLFSV